jgi:putative sterol carrier protein
MAASSTPAAYYTQIVPQQFAAALSGAPGDVAAQPELTAVYEVTGEGGDIYGLRAVGTQIEVVPGALPTADMSTTITIEDWRKAFASGDTTDPFVDNIRRGKVAVVKSLAGTVRLELERSDGGIWRSTTIFGGVAEPEVTLRMTADDYEAMMRGDLNGQMAFLTGKLTFEGSLPLLMQIGALSA